MLKKIGLFIVIVLCTLSFGAAQAQTPSVTDLDMVKSLATKLAVKPEQAAGAAGAIFGFAKTKLSADNFTKLSGSVPGMDQLLNAAPPMGAAGSALAQLAPNASGIASLAGSFQKLGMSPDMIGKFVPEILTAVEGKGGAEAKSLLSGVLK